MIVTCYDCGSDSGHFRQWRYPCDECREEFVAKHREQGHHVEVRPESRYGAYRSIPV